MPAAIVESTHVWPIGTERTADGELTLEGVPVSQILGEYGSPVYVYSETTIREAIQSWQQAANDAFGTATIVYASKAFMAKGLLEVVNDEGCGVDVVSGGELGFALASGTPASRITLHGNNKTDDELQAAVDARIGKVILDDKEDAERLAALASTDSPMRVGLRVNPGVDVHTHKKISTGMADSKFGLPLADGQAEAAVKRILELPNLEFVGYHAHLGSQLFEMDATEEAIGDMVEFAVRMQSTYGAPFTWLSPGGGFGIAYLPKDEPPAPSVWMNRLALALRSACEKYEVDVPAVTFEPGRSVIGRAGVALYTIGSRKELEGIRTYVSVDGGMADNIRPTLYEAKYHAELANRLGDGDTETVTIAGKYCESGDILIADIDLPHPVRGDILAIPAAGAYCLAMASNYNMAFRPAVVMVRNGKTRLIRRRETLDDLLQREE